MVDFCNFTQGPLRLIIWLVVLWGAPLFCNAQSNLLRIKSFAEPKPDTAFPIAAPILATNGWLYGTTPYGGLDGAGSIYRVRSNGTGYEILHSFDSSIGESVPFLGLTAGSNGDFFGATAIGITSEFGSVFQLSFSGEYVKLFDVPRSGANRDPIEVNSILNGNNGLFYASAGSPPGYSGMGGQILKFARSSGHYDTFILWEGRSPSSLILGSDNVIYGILSHAGNGSGDARLFKVNLDGSGYVEFGPTNAFLAHLQETSDGQLIALAGITNAIVLVKTDKIGSYLSHLYSFPAQFNLSDINIITSGDGNIYGTIAREVNSGPSLIFRISENNYTNIHVFRSDSQSLIDLPGTLSEGPDGYLYGVTIGTDKSFGTIYRMAKDDWQFRVLHKFLYTSDGAMPMDGLILASDGNFYGTTARGGENHMGTVFRLNSNGTHNVLNHFRGGVNGAVPLTGLVEGRDGSLYGNTTLSPSSIYAINKDGSNFRILHSITSRDLGNDFAIATLIQGKDGKLYGPTFFGSIFCLSTNGTEFQILREFEGFNSPMSSLIEPFEGWLFGMLFDSSISPAGLIFSMDTGGGNFKTAASFDQVEGTQPRGGLIFARDGRLYGTADNIFSMRLDGSDYRHHISVPTKPMGLIEAENGLLYGNESGAVFHFDRTASTYSILVNFDRADKGLHPKGKLVEDANNDIYGVTTFGGEHTYWFPFHSTREGQGTIFRLSSHPVELRINSVKTDHVGLTLRIIGPPNKSFAIEATDSLVDPVWKRIASELYLDLGGNYEITDTAASGVTRFYRATY